MKSHRSSTYDISYVSDGEGNQMTSRSGTRGVDPHWWQVADKVSTASISTQLLRRGFRSTFMTGVAPLRPELRMAGYAFTLRYAPAREDVGTGLDFDNRTNIQRLAVESVSQREVLVIDARGELSAASLGHILATRLMVRGAAGLVTDGALRDSPSFADLDLPVYSRGAHATTSATIHHPVESQVVIGCAGVLVMPGDVLIGDAEGVVVVPQSVAVDVVLAAADQDEFENFLLERVQSGATLEGTYPPNEATRAEYAQRGAGLADDTGGGDTGGSGSAA